MATLALEHFHELQDHVADERFHLLKAVERELNLRFPELYQDLYSMITFTTIPYAEARRIDRAQRVVVDQLLGLPGAQEKVRTGELATVAEPMLRALWRELGPKRTA
jgi:kynurenine 3-monooxygenase